MFLRSFFRENKLPLFITLFFFLVPFFWLRPGEMDLGGDANRLYFYDPIQFLKATGMYAVVVEGKGSIDPKHYYIPYVLLIAFIKSIVRSSTVVISIFNGIKLVGGFIGIFLIVQELLLQAYGMYRKEFIRIAAVLSGVFYVVSQASIHLVFSWDRALFTHDQIFLNPIVFYLLLKFFLTHRYAYLWSTLLLTFIFATNFGLAAAPSLFAFYPLTLLFLFLYIMLVRKKSPPWKGIAIGLLLGLGIHAFHLLPSVNSLIDTGSVAHTVVFDKKEIEAGGVGYFAAVRGHGQAILNLLLPLGNFSFEWPSLLVPLILVFSFILDTKKRRDVLLVSLFFFLAFFLATANITNVGFELYKRLFYIPGFAMFRVFFEKWMFVYVFFYSLLFGFALITILSRLKWKYARIATLIAFALLMITGVPLFLGEPVNKATIRGSNNMRTSFTMDPSYERTLEFIRTLNDGKILVLPLTDFFRQVIAGLDGGAYEGPSTLLHLTNRYSFVGYQHFGYKVSDSTPYAEDIMKYAREKKYDRLLRIFTSLNIRYILHNSDPLVYEKGFSPGPYGYMQTSLPKTQEEYKEFIRQFPVREIYKEGYFVIYELDPSAYNSTVFIPERIYQSDRLSFDEKYSHSVFIQPDICKKEPFTDLCNESYRSPSVEMEFTMINPTIYRVTIRPQEKIGKMLLVMQHSFHTGWKLFFNNKSVAEDSHIVVNGYANGWVISDSDVLGNKEIILFIKLDQQKYFWYGVYLTVPSLGILFIVMIVSLIKKL